LTFDFHLVEWGHSELGGTRSISIESYLAKGSRLVLKRERFHAPQMQRTYQPQAETF